MNGHYKDRHVPNHICPICKITLTVNENVFKTINPERPSYQRRLVCPNFFVNGCKYTEKWTPEIEAELIEAAAMLALQPAEF